MKKDTNSDKAGNLTKSKIFSDVIIESNKRLLYVFLAIAVLANVAVTAIKAAGIGSKYLDYTDIAVQAAVVAVVLGVTVLLSNMFKGKKASGYVMITGVTLCCAVFEYTFHGADQLFATRYIPLALSIFYFDTKISIFTLILIFLSQTTMFVIRPELRIPGPVSNTAVRYILFFMTGLGAIFGARATKKLLKLAVYEQEEASSNLANLRSIARAVIRSIELLKKEAAEQEGASREMNAISQNQAASLEEISASLEELASNSSMISETSRSLYEELDITVESVSDLKAVNDKIQTSYHETNRSLNDVAEYSNATKEQIRLTEDKFSMVKIKSADMANFVQVIDDIADKVNLLSLNAAIEAARAGDYGRGFAVVADEISKLADATTRNAKMIGNIIKDNLSLIDESGNLINQSVETMTKLNNSILTIKGVVAEVGNLIDDISVTVKAIKNLNVRIKESSKTIENSTREQKIATDESSRTGVEISTKSQEIVAIAGNLARSTMAIKELASELDRVVKEMIK
jgi:methyl-accepting chemotaxis protein